MKHIAFLTVITLPLLLLSCSTAQQKAPSYSEMLTDITGQNGRACVRTRDIDGYGVLKGNVVNIDGGRDYYVATMLPGCFNLDTSFVAAFVSRYNEVCGRSLDRVYTNDDQCTINKMYKFDDREHALAAHELATKRRETILDLNH